MPSCRGTRSGVLQAGDLVLDSEFLAFQPENPEAIGQWPMVFVVDCFFKLGMFAG